MAKSYPPPRRFLPRNPHKYVGDISKIIARSSWELKFMRWCDGNPSVLKYASEEIVVPYWSKADNKQRRYFVDFVVEMIDINGEIKKLLIEIKPHSQTIPPIRGRKRAETFMNESYAYQVNRDKWDAAHDFATRNDMKFIIMTEYDLFSDKNRP